MRRGTGPQREIYTLPILPDPLDGEYVAVKFRPVNIVYARAISCLTCFLKGIRRSKRPGKKPGQNYFIDSSGVIR